MTPLYPAIKKIRTTLIFLVFVLILCPSALEAQTAASYPFTASQKTFTPITGGTTISAFLDAPALPGSPWDDGYYPNIPIGFTFTFCGVQYTTVTAHTNGYMSFGNASATYWLTINSSILANMGPCVIAGWMDASGDQVSLANSPTRYVTTGVAPNRVFTLEFLHWGSYDYSQHGNYISYQYKLYESGPVEIIYRQESGTSVFGKSTTYPNGGAPCVIGIAKSSTDWQSLNNVSANPTSSSTVFTTSISGKPATGQSYLWGKVPCTGTPVASVVSQNPVCINKPFVVSLSGLGIYSGLTYQWQESTNGNSWTNFTGTGAGTDAITDVITTSKWYRCIITCTYSGQSYTTPGYQVNAAPFYYCYCDGSKASSGGGVDVGNIKVIAHPSNELLLDNGNATPFLSNSSANKTYSEFRYSVPPIPMYHDSSYRFQLSQTSSASSFTAGMATIFIDYNRNGTFDTFERILLEPTTASLPFPGLVTDTFKIPDTAGYGLTGMRVILRAGNVKPDTCTSYPEGETEDYLVELRYDPCTGTPTAGKIEGDTSMCVGYEYTLTDSTYQKFRHGLVHMWQRSADGVNWVDIANSVGKDSIQRLFTGQPLHYRVRMVCTVTKDTSFSPVHKVNIKPNYKCYCFSQSTGKQSDTSDIGGLEIGPYNYTDGGSHLNNPRAWRPRTDYTDLAPIELIMDSLYSFYIYHTQFNNNHGDSKITVFMDFDNDTKYDIPDERVYTGFTNVGYHTLVSKMQVAEYAIVDVPTGMRIIVNNDVAPNTPSDEACGTYTSGETEDYMVIFRRWPTGVKEIKDVENVDLYPNPTGGRFTVSLKSSSAKEIQVKVSSVTGQQVQVKHYSHQGGRFAEELDLSSEAKGIYFVEIEAGGEKFVRKLVVR